MGNFWNFLMKMILILKKTFKSCKDYDFEENFQKLQRLWFVFPLINNSIEYQNLWVEVQDDEWLYVTLSDAHKQFFLGRFLQLANTTDAYNLVDSDNYKNLKIVFLVYGNQILFSYIEPRFLIKHQTKFVIFDERVILQEEHDSLVFEWKIYAYFDWNNKIYFRNFINARKIFWQNFTKAFEKMASEQEALEFLSNQNFFKWDISRLNISDRNRKIIASIKERISVLENSENFNKFIEYWKQIQNPRNSVKISEDNKFLLENTKDIKNVLYLLEERIYITPITNEERVATSYTK